MRIIICRPGLLLCVYLTHFVRTCPYFLDGVLVMSAAMDVVSCLPCPVFPHALMGNHAGILTNEQLKPQGAPSQGIMA